MESEHAGILCNINTFVFTYRRSHTRIIASHTSGDISPDTDGIFDFLGISEADRMFLEESTSVYRGPDRSDTLVLEGKHGTVFIYIGAYSSSGMCIAFETNARAKSVSRLILSGALPSVTAAPSVRMEDSIIRRGDGDTYNSICDIIGIIHNVFDAFSFSSSVKLSKEIMSRAQLLASQFGCVAQVDIRRGIALAGTVGFDEKLCMMYIFCATMRALRYSSNKTLSIIIENFEDRVSVGYSYNADADAESAIDADIFRSVCDTRGMLKEFSIENGTVRSRICPVYPDWALLGIKSDVRPLY